MNCIIRYAPNLLRNCIALSLFLVVPQAATAVDLPWFNIGSGTVADGISVVPGVQKQYEAQGFSIPVGRYGSEGNNVETIEFQGPDLPGKFKGDFNFKNRFLGQLRTTFGDVGNGAENPGTFTVVEQGDGTVRIFFFAEFNPKVGESTGIFSKVMGGSLLMSAISTPFRLEEIVDGVTPPFGIAWFGFGSLEFGE